MNEYCDKYLTFKDITQDELDEFRKCFAQLVKISLWNTGGTQYLSKNPPHTSRIKVLHEMYPNARFVYLMRNPYTVFESTRNFFRNTIKPLQLHHIDDEELQNNILRNYMEMYHAYKEQKKHVPEGHIYEVKFEDIEKDAYGITHDIYDKLEIPGWEDAMADIEKYIGGKRGYKKNKYQYDPLTVSLVNEHWGEVLDEWGYERL